MKTAQSIDFLETISDIPVRDMARGMFNLIRAAARNAQKSYPGMAGYYDPEYEGKRAQPENFLFRPAFYTETIPQSLKLQEKTINNIPDPLAND